MKSWISYPKNHPFPIQNIPFGVFCYENQESHCATKIGDYVIDLFVLAEAGIFPDWGKCFLQPTLNDFMAQGRLVWKECRSLLQGLFKENGALKFNKDLQERCMKKQNDVRMLLPAKIGDYTDFYSSIWHASNLGTMFRGKEKALQENWLHIPVGYHGRASSVIVSGTPVKRPMGQIRNDPHKPPTFEPCGKLDFELEIAFFVGNGNHIGEPIPIEKAHEHIFGLVLMNDWSARDIQKWEYVPLGPFNGKNFSTTISPWIITMEALEPFKCNPHDQSARGPEKTPLPYLCDPDLHAYDINLRVSLQPKGEEMEIIGKTSSRNLYWTFEQQLCHHTSTGCPLNPGDLCASGTISGQEIGSFGSMIEICWGGKRLLKLEKSNQTRSWIADGDTINMSGFCNGDGYVIGFGECSGIVLPTNKV